LKHPRVAILLACYYPNEWLKTQINSIFEQQNVSIHIYISDDSGKEIAQSILFDILPNKKITILPQIEPSGSPGKNFFRLLKDVNFENFDFVAFSDQDDIWFEMKLYSSIKQIIETSSDVYSSDVKAFWSSGKTKILKKSYEQVNFDYLFEASGPGCTYVFKKKIALLFQKFLLQNDLSKIWVHDWMLYAFARSNDFKWFHDVKINVDYRQHSKNSIGINSGLKSIIYRFKMIRNGFYREQSINICEVLKLYDYKIFEALKRNWIGSLYILKNIRNCRRSWKDQLFLAICCLFNIY
jgi:rhamnosyltransferase